MVGALENRRQCNLELNLCFNVTCNEHFLLLRVGAAKHHEFPLGLIKCYEMK